MLTGLKRRVREILEDTPGAGATARVVSLMFMVVILLNVLAVILETVPALALHYGQEFRLFEIFSVALFTVEYVLRLWPARSILGSPIPSPAGCGMRSIRWHSLI
jgi:voltage-gated potassium channel